MFCLFNNRPGDKEISVLSAKLRYQSRGLEVELGSCSVLLWLAEIHT